MNHSSQKSLQTSTVSNRPNLSRTIRARANGEEPTAEMLDFPGVEDGIRGMQFIDSVVSAGYNDKVKWVKFGEQ